MKLLPSVIVCFGLVLAGTGGASAQELEQRQLKLSAAVWTAAVASDHVTTFQFRTKYPDLLHEQNPLVRGLEEHPAWLVGVNAAIDAAAGWAAYKWLGTRHPRLATLAFYGAAAYRASLGIHNVRMMNKARAIAGTVP